MVEQELKLVNANRKDKEGNDLYNVYIKTYLNKSTGEVYQGLLVDNYIIVEKIFAEAFKTKFGGSAKVRYQDKVCSFFVDEKSLEEYNNAGGIGDKVKITAYTNEYTYENKKKTSIRFHYEKVE